MGIFIGKYLLQVTNIGMTNSGAQTSLEYVLRRMIIYYLQRQNDHAKETFYSEQAKTMDRGTKEIPSISRSGSNG
jgi:hypothetical protein